MPGQALDTWLRTNKHPQQELIGTSTPASCTTDGLAHDLQFAEAAETTAVVVHVEGMPVASGRLWRFLRLNRGRVVEVIADQQIRSSVIQLVEIAQTPKKMGSFESGSAGT